MVRKNLRLINSHMITAVRTISCKPVDFKASVPTGRYVRLQTYAFQLGHCCSNVAYLCLVAIASGQPRISPQSLTNPSIQEKIGHGFLLTRWSIKINDCHTMHMDTMHVHMLRHSFWHGHDLLIQVLGNQGGDASRSTASFSLSSWLPINRILTDSCGSFKGCKLSRRKGCVLKEENSLICELV